MSPSGDDEEEEVVITVPAAQQAGVWANWAAINESDNAFVESPPTTPGISPIGQPLPLGRAVVKIAVVEPPVTVAHIFNRNPSSW